MRPDEIQDESYVHHPCGCVEFRMFGATEPGSLDPSCPIHGVCTCIDPNDDRECPMHREALGSRTEIRSNFLGGNGA